MATEAKHERYGKEIRTPDEHEDEPGQTLYTENPDVIRAWADERGAKPVTATRRDDRPATLRLDFPGYGGEDLEEVSWDEWLGVFTDRNLTFVFQEHTSDGSDSNFFRITSPEREDA